MDFLTFLRNISIETTILSFALAIGGGVYEGLLINPQWSKSPPSSFGLIQDKTGIPLQKFWIPAHIVITIAHVAALCLNWSLTQRRNLILVSLASYLVMRAWSFLYFIPRMIQFQKIPLTAASTAQLTLQVKRWSALTWYRTPLDVISFLFLLWARALL